MPEAFDNNIRTLRTALRCFYREHRRDLPWRETRDPYAIWVSEIMLQQTRVATAAPRFREFVHRYPNVESLAAATAEEVCEAWAGLGYYQRARNLHAAAQLIHREHRGRLPKSAAALQRLPGIGRYTAGAIASLCFDETVAAVDGNVVRVIARLAALPGAATDVVLQKHVWRLATKLVGRPRPGDLNQALMELGATVCTPRTPSCDACPVQRLCAASAAGVPTRYPSARIRTKQRSLTIAFAWIESRQGIWLQQRPLDGMWAGLWELPSESGHGAKAKLAARLQVTLGPALAQVRHDLTHRRVTARVYRPSNPPQLRYGPSMRRFAAPLEAPLSALARKAISATRPEENRNHA